MIQVKTPDGYKLPDNIFYKNGSTFVQVKKVYSNQRVLERTAICSCELGTSKLIKSLRALIVTYTDLINYTAEPEKSELINAVAEMENEIESLKIDQLIYNQQLTIIDNDRDLRNQVIPAVYGLNLVTEYAINNTPNPQIAVKIVVGNNTVNPDIEFSPLPANMFKYNGDYYYVGNQSDQTTILENITSIFGEGKVALQVYSANEIIDILRVTVTERSALNIAQLRKIGIQQDLIDSAVSARRLKVLIDSTLEDSNTDSAVKAFYEVASITDVVDGNITSTTIKMNVDLRMSNLLPATKLDIKTPLFPFTLDSLNTKSDEILGYTNLVKNVNVSPIISPSAMTQIYTSSDIHEFKFDKMGRVYSGVKDTIVNQPIEQNTYTYTTNIPVTLDATWSGGVNYTVTGTTNSPIITTNGQFATALWKMTGYGRTGKVYFEVEVKSKNTTGGVYIGIQRVPTKKGNYHNGTSSNGNGGISLSSSITTPIGKHSVVIDLSTGELIIDGVSLGILGGTGDVYFGVYDGDSAGTGQIQLFFHPQDYTLQVPANVSTWIESTKHTTYLDNYVDVLYDTGKHSYITSEKNDTLYVISANVKPYIDITARDNVITEIYNRVKSLEESVKLSTSISYPISYISDTITTTPMKVAFESSKGRRVISEISNVIEIIPENVVSIPTTNETKRYIISQLSSNITNIKSNCKFSAGITNNNDSGQHSKIISILADNTHNLQENVLTSTVPHTRVISLVDAVPYLIGDVIATAVSHPELATPTSDVVQLTTGKVKLNSVIIPIISNVESPILNVVENVNAVNDPIPFTVYQQSIGSVCQFGKPIIEPSSIDIYVSSVKNIGAMSRIDPIMVISDKIPNYISTQTNMTSVINVSDVVTGVVSIDSYVVSQLSLISPTLDIPKCDVQAVEIYVAESKSNNIASFDTVVKLNTPEISSYIVSSINENVASFDEVIKVTNTVAVSNAIIDIKSNKTISFDDDISGIVLFNNESNDKVIDVKSNKVLTFDMDIEGIMNFNNESNDKVIDVKSNKVLTFDMDVDTSLNSGETVFIISNGLAYSSTDINNLIVVTDSLDGKNYAVTRGTDGIIESYETTQSVTKNNYFYDEITKLTYKITSSGGFLDMVSM